MIALRVTNLAKPRAFSGWKSESLWALAMVVASRDIELAKQLRDIALGPDTATGAELDAYAILTGTLRNTVIKGTITV